jgi:hypothetical protein
MNRPRILRWLRITWTGIWGLAAVLLIALWVRSYSWMDFSLLNSQTGLVSATGSLIYVNDASTSLPLGWSSMLAAPAFVEALRFEAPKAIIVPFRWLVTAGLPLVIVPWLPWRFSLRTLLIVTMLVAVLLGLIMWAMRG